VGVWGSVRFLVAMPTTSSLGLGLGCQWDYRVADDKHWHHNMSLGGLYIYLREDNRSQQPSVR
jgi:hypothetical protein